MFRRLLFCAALGFVLVEIDLSPLPASPEPASAGPREPAPTTAPPHRILAVLVDSLRFDVAMDPAIMPTLARLRDGSLWGMTTPCRDEVTTECLRAAFSGRDRSSALTAVAGRTAAVDRSLLPFALRARGLSTFVCSEQGERLLAGAVDGCGAADTGASNLWNDAARADAALSAYATGGHAVVLAHLVEADELSHVVRVGEPAYREAFRRTDALLARFATALRPGDTLWVFGDHGHDERGRHLFGVASRTFHLYRGPAFADGRRDLGMVDHRLLLGALLDEPPGADYEGIRAQAMFAPTLTTARPWLTRLAHEPAAATAGPAWRPRAAILALLGALLAALLALEAREFLRQRAVAVALAVAAVAVVGLGLAYPEVREFLYARSWIANHLCFAGVAALACLAVRPSGLIGVAMVSMIAAFSILPPTVSGFGALRGTSLALGLAFLALRPPGRPRAEDAAVAALLAAFHVVTGQNFRIQHMDLFEAAARHGLTIPVAIAAQLALTLPLPVPWRARLVAAALGLLTLATPELPGPVSLAMFAGGTMVALAAAAGARVGIAAAMFAAQLALGVAFQGETTRQVAVLALWALGGLLVRAAARSPDERAPHLAGLSLAWLAAYAFWPTMAGRFGDTDWRFALAWIDVATADRQWWLTTLLLWGKYLLPLFGLVALLRAQLPDRAPLALATAVRLIGFRAFALAGFCAALATRAWLSGMYREAAETAILTGVLALTLSLVASPETARASIAAPSASPASPGVA